MYSRDYAGETVNFEASGGLVNASLIMQDQETDTYWSIMEGEALTGELAGEELLELPVSEKMQWRHWRRKHPDTIVLSVDGVEDGPNAYAPYYQNPNGFAGRSAEDERLATKAPIFAFHRDGQAYAVSQKAIEDGATFELEDGTNVFLYRKAGASMFQSTYAFVSDAGFESEGDTWIEKASGASFDAASGELPGVEILTGFDTFWYNFSLNNPETRLLE